MKYSELVEGLETLNKEAYELLNDESKEVVECVRVQVVHGWTDVKFKDELGFTTLYSNGNFDIHKACLKDLDNYDVEELHDFISTSKRMLVLKEAAMANVFKVVTTLKES